MIRHAFKFYKTIKCYRCNDKAMTSFAGLKYHLQTCGKSQDEIENQMGQCPYCPYKGFIKGYLKNHIQSCRFNAPPPVTVYDTIKVEDPDPLDVTSSGRKKRGAAKRASQRMSAVIGKWRSNLNFWTNFKDFENYRINVGHICCILLKFPGVHF